MAGRGLWVGSGQGAGQGVRGGQQGTGVRGMYRRMLGGAGRVQLWPASGGELGPSLTSRR